jgi:hypothetical protein
MHMEVHMERDGKCVNVKWANNVLKLNKEWLTVFVISVHCTMLK